MLWLSKCCSATFGCASLEDLGLCDTTRGGFCSGFLNGLLPLLDVLPWGTWGGVIQRGVAFVVASQCCGANFGRASLEDWGYCDLTVMDSECCGATLGRASLEDLRRCYTASSGFESCGATHRHVLPEELRLCFVIRCTKSRLLWCVPYRLLSQERYRGPFGTSFAGGPGLMNRTS